MVSTSMRVIRTARHMAWFLVGIPAVATSTVFLPIFAGVPLDSGYLGATMIMAILLIIAVLLVKTTALSLTSDAIHYRSLLHRVQIDLADVVKVECAFGFIAFSYKPYQRIVVTTRGKSGDKEIILNGGLFDQREIKQWVDTCNSTLNKE